MKTTKKDYIKIAKIIISETGGELNEETTNDYLARLGERFVRHATYSAYAAKDKDGLKYDSQGFIIHEKNEKGELTCNDVVIDVIVKRVVDNRVTDIRLS